MGYTSYDLVSKVVSTMKIIQSGTEYCQITLWWSMDQTSVKQKWQPDRGVQFCSPSLMEDEQNKTLSARFWRSPFGVIFKCKPCDKSIVSDQTKEQN